MKKLNWLIFTLFVITTVNCWAQVGSVIWQEDFNTLNTNIWNVVTGDGTGTPAGTGWGNMELEYYNTANVYIADIPGESGNKGLVLEAKRENMGSSAFTSGKVTCSDKLSIKYGLVEMRVRVPNLATGLWPAGWLLGTSNSNWPAKGEIDMMEMGHNITERTRQGFPNAPINNFAGSNLIFYSSTAVSTANPSGAASTAWDVTYDSPYVAPTPLNDRFVLYRMYWTSTSIRFTIVDNGTETDLYTSPFTITSESDEFQNPFYLIFNLAVGGTFTDAPSNGQVTAPLPGKMYVDYVKVSKWNNQGEVKIGGPDPETGTFGVFTDNTPTTNKLVAGTSSDIWAWNNLVAGNTAPYEGSNVIAWATTTPNTWFGGGIVARQPKNMSNFKNGNLKFRIKIPANVSFKIGMTDNYTNEKYISFPANTNQFGLTRDGNWGQVTIPISQFAGTLAFQSMNYLFTIANDVAIPSSTFQLALDDIYWEGGGGGCTATAINPYLQINGGAWQNVSTASLAVGGSVVFGPQPTDGTWKWTGPNNFSSSSREVTISNIQSTQGGNYVGTYTNPGGCTSTVTYNITVTGGCTASTITPYLQVNGGAWQSVTSASLIAGGNIILGPQPTTGTWKWTGPNNFTSTSREITISNIQTNQGGNYIGTYTNTSGCNSTTTFAISVQSTNTLIAKIEAENYSSMNGIQTETCSEGTLDVAYIDASDWLAYNSITIPSTGTYTLQYRIASVSGGTLSSDLNGGATQLGNVTIPATGGWQTWSTINQVVTLNAGTYNFGIFAQTGGWNINWFSITQGTLKSASASETAADFKAEKVSIYPNPAADLITIKGVSENNTITILNTQGQQLLQITATKDETSLDVSNLKKGLYFIKTGNGESSPVKFIKN